jgi:hypothetical protein
MILMPAETRLQAFPNLNNIFGADNLSPPHKILIVER